MPNTHLRVPLYGPVAVSWRRFEAGVVAIPVGGILVLLLFVALSPWPSSGIARGIIAGALGVAGVVGFSTVVLRSVQAARQNLVQTVAQERSQREQLDALHIAAIAMAQDLDLTGVLERVVDLSRRVIRCRYAALRVLTENGPGDFLTSGMSQEEIRALGALPEGRGVLGVVARSETTIRLSRIQDHAQSVGFPSGHPPMRTLLGTAVRFRDRIFGYIYLTEKEDGEEFTEEDERTLERFAAHAGAVIANAHLMAEVGRLGTVAERERIGRELHDGTLQELYAIALRLQAALPLEGEGGDHASGGATVDEGAVRDAITSVSQAMANIRTYVFGQDGRSPRSVEAVDLIAALRDVTTGLGRQENGRIETRFDLPDPFAVPPDAAHQIVQWVREAATNAVRHSQAQHIRCVASFEGDAFCLGVEDDGAGFDAEQAGRAGHGLENMRLRAAALGGHVTFVTAPGAGTRVELRVPAARLMTGKE